MAAKSTDELAGSERNELFCVYSAMICHDAGVSATADNINALVSAAGGSVPPFFASLFSKLCDSQGDLSGLMKFGGGGGGGVATAAAAGGGGGGSGPAASKEEEKKIEEEEEEEE
eukprot:CAMPEP_0194488094 /NCGR_PEP_ID=MMETSP0253-20130528/8148_1 /TAXON_ID=2966 /ORGANISM="Noctiluca scintillans" /LENGTH=114 /DNA_ID=CAMNT_0039328415 /DNA_START=52 /DNA_END=393 /DNA_ORIENTATION=+